MNVTAHKIEGDNIAITVVLTPELVRRLDAGDRELIGELIQRGAITALDQVFPRGLVQGAGE